MTTVQITLPDTLAKEAANAGLLAPDKIESLLRQQLRAERIARGQAARQTLAANPLPQMTSEEVQAEIKAYRAEQQHAVRP